MHHVYNPNIFITDEVHFEDEYKLKPILKGDIFISSIDRRNINI